MKYGCFMLLLAALALNVSCISDSPETALPDKALPEAVSPEAALPAAPEPSTAPEAPATTEPSAPPQPLTPPGPPAPPEPPAPPLKQTPPGPPGTNTPPPPGYTLPIEEVSTSRFGIVDVQQDIGEINSLGIRWDRPHPGPFIWGHLEPEKGNYDWREADEYIQMTQGFSFTTIATIWPFAAWDQAGWDDDITTSIIFEEEVGRGRRKPHDMDAYRAFVTALVERYDGDGQDDAPGLVYPVKHWEAGNEPSLQKGYATFFNGTPEDYLEILQTTCEAVREADPEAKVLHAGMAGLYENNITFWEPVFENGEQYFDIANIHCVEDPDALNVVPRFRELLAGYGIEKPIWVTEVQHNSRIGLEEHGELIVESYAVYFANGAEKIFYTMFNIPPFAPAQHQESALITGQDKRPGYHALKTLVLKLDRFTSAVKIAEGQYKFMVNGKPVYIIWGSGQLPGEINGEVIITDIYGEETTAGSSAIEPTDSPVFIEP